MKRISRKYYCLLFTNEIQVKKFMNLEKAILNKAECLNFYDIQSKEIVLNIKFN